MAGLNYVEYRRLLSLVGQIREDPADQEDTDLDGLSRDIRDSISGINTILFKKPRLEGIGTKGEWVRRIGGYIKAQTERKNQIDRDFYHVLMLAQVLSLQDMAELARGCFAKLDSVTRERYIRFYNDFSHFWGPLDLQAGEKGAISERAALLKKRNGEFSRLYERLGDYRSKRVLSNMINNWMSFDISLITGMKENCFADYFDPDLFDFSEEEVVVDLGAYTGDTALEYIEQIGTCRKIYCYEITAKSVEKMRDRLRMYPGIEIRHKGVADRAGRMFVLPSPIRQTANRLRTEEDGSGSFGADKAAGSRTEGSADARAVNAANVDAENAENVEIVTLDDDMKEPFTFLKMDIEGAEQAALRGSRNHILCDRPKLAISVYHSNRDIIEIPGLISSIRDDYQYFLRSHGSQWGPSEITLLCK